MKLFHYTSVETYLKIAETGKIRLSDLSQSNDAQEGRIILEPLFRDLKNGLDNELSEFLVNQVEEIFHGRRDLGFCMSTEADLLSQWRGYADSGQGVCIGFDSDILLKAVRDCKGLKGTELVKVEYGQGPAGNASSKFVKFVDELAIRPEYLERIEDDIHRFETFGMPDSDDEETVSGKLYQKILELSSSAFRYKQSAFEEEREYRLVLPVTFGRDREVQFMSRGSRIVEYASASIGRSITSIWVGPRCQATKWDVRKVALKYGVLKNPFSTVEKSDSSFR